MDRLNLKPIHVYGLTETYGPITKGYEIAEWASLETKEKYARRAHQGHGFITSLATRVIKIQDEAEDRDQYQYPIVDVEKNGKEIGEVVFLGNICARGYYKNPAATRKLFAGGVQHTGDLAVWHPSGAIQVVDRVSVPLGRIPIWDVY